ncbi:MAG: hypothetical protein RLZZ292_3359 [Bacteroidota bacterium]|jgi:hypothetical protein
MNEKERKLTLIEIRNLQDLIDNADADNPNIAGWKQNIKNLKAMLD